MKTKFLGAFEKQLVKNAGSSDISNTSLPYLNRLDKEFIYETEGSYCLVWGNFYDLTKTCNDLKISVTANPAEAILMAVKNANYQAVDAFYGEFTYLIVENEKIIIGRDLIGAGLPVFYTDHYFSNSIDSFKTIKGFDFALDTLSVRTFLHLGTPLPPATIIKDVKQLSAGEYLIYSDNKISTHFLLSYQKYEQLYGSLKISEPEAVSELERLHKNAIKRRIENKKNIALLMSGGYDSGGNVEALRELYDGKISGYSIGFKNDEWSELPLAQLLAKEFDIDFHDYQIDGSEIVELPRILRSLGNPFQENGVMVNYTVMKRVNQDQNDIILGGDGNDQLYGTGMQQVAMHYYSSKFGLKPIQSIISGITAGSHHKLFSRINFHNNRILNAGQFTTFGFNASELNNLLNLPKEKLNTDILTRNHLKAKTFDELFKTHTYFKDFMHDGNGLIIFKASNMARLFNQHLSFPYMDKDSIEFIMKLPRELRISGTVKDIAKGHGTAKLLHKKYLKPKLPAEITQRKKQGGFAPLPNFFKDESRRKMIYELIRNSALCLQIFNKDYLEKFFDKYESICKTEDTWFWDQQSMAFRMFNLLVLTVWWEIHINNKSGEDLKDFL